MIPVPNQNVDWSPHRADQLRCLHANLRALAFQVLLASADAIKADDRAEAQRLMMRFNQVTDLAFRIRSRIDRADMVACLERAG